MRSVVLLHGFAGTPAAWDDVRTGWPALALPGHGRPAPATWAAALDDLAARIDRDAVVVGYSLGARLALGLLAEGAIARAVLVSVNPGIDDAARAARLADDARWAARLRTDGLAAFLDAWEAQPLFATAARAPAERRARRRAARETLDPDALATTMEALSLARMPDYRGALAAHADRAHLVVGADDAKFRALAAEAAAATPGLAVDVVDGSGHDPTLEAPAALAAVLRRYASPASPG